ARWVASSSSTATATAPRARPTPARLAARSSWTSTATAGRTPASRPRSAARAAPTSSPVCRRAATPFASRSARPSTPPPRTRAPAGDATTVAVVPGPGPATVNLGFLSPQTAVASTVGMFDPSTGIWYLRHSNGPGAPDIAPFAYGGRGWIGVVGDWDGDGVRTVRGVDAATTAWEAPTSR